MSAAATPEAPEKSAARRHLRDIFAGCAREFAERPNLAKPSCRT